MTKPVPGQTFPLTSLNTWESGLGPMSNVLGCRDAFHVPSVLVTDARTIDREDGVRPGTNVRFTNDECTQVEPCEYSERQAIADPFLEHIDLGVAFWVFIIPELIGDLTHNFEILSKPKDNPLDNIADEYEEPEGDGCDWSRC